MVCYAIIETEAGLTVTEMKHEGRPEDEALRSGGVVVDPGPYRTYDDAYDAMLAMEGEDPEDDLD